MLQCSDKCRLELISLLSNYDLTVVFDKIKEIYHESLSSTLLSIRKMNQSASNEEVKYLAEIVSWYIINDVELKVNTVTKGNYLLLKKEIITTGSKIFKCLAITYFKKNKEYGKQVFEISQSREAVICFIKRFTTWEIHRPLFEFVQYELNANERYNCVKEMTTIKKYFEEMVKEKLASFPDTFEKTLWTNTKDTLVNNIKLFMSINDAKFTTGRTPIGNTFSITFENNCWHVRENLLDDTLVPIHPFSSKDLDEAIHYLLKLYTPDPNPRQITTQPFYQQHQYPIVRTGGRRTVAEAEMHQNYH